MSGGDAGNGPLPLEPVPSHQAEGGWSWWEGTGGGPNGWQPNKRVMDLVYQGGPPLIFFYIHSLSEKRTRVGTVGTGVVSGGVEGSYVCTEQKPRVVHLGGIL